MSLLIHKSLNNWILRSFHWKIDESQSSNLVDRKFCRSFFCKSWVSKSCFLFHTKLEKHCWDFTNLSEVIGHGVDVKLKESRRFCNGVEDEPVYVLAVDVIPFKKRPWVFQLNSVLARFELLKRLLQRLLVSILRVRIAQQKV